MQTSVLLSRMVGHVGQLKRVRSGEDAAASEGGKGTYASGGLGSRFTVLISSICSLGSSQNSSGFLPGTELSKVSMSPMTCWGWLKMLAATADEA